MLWRISRTLWLQIWAIGLLRMVATGSYETGRISPCTGRPKRSKRAAERNGDRGSTRSTFFRVYEQKRTKPRTSHDVGASESRRWVQLQRAKTRSFRALHFLAYRHTSVTRASVTLSAAICRVRQPPSADRIDKDDGGDGLIVTLARARRRDMGPREEEETCTWNKKENITSLRYQRKQWHWIAADRLPFLFGNESGMDARMCTFAVSIINARFFGTNRRNFASRSFRAFL